MNTGAAPRAASTSGRARRRASATATGTIASSTRPYERNAVMPAEQAAEQREPIARAVAHARSRARPAPPPNAATPAKKASPDDHQIAAGASTRNGVAARRAGVHRRRSRTATSAAAPAAAAPATASNAKPAGAAQPDPGERPQQQRHARRVPARVRAVGVDAVHEVRRGTTCGSWIVGSATR